MELLHIKESKDGSTRRFSPENFHRIHVASSQALIPLLLYQNISYGIIEKAHEDNEKENYLKPT